MTEVNQAWMQRNKHLQYLEEAQKELETESDRGIVLVCLSILDELLAELLKTRFLQDEKLMKDMFGTKGVYGQFDDKVKACYAIGLISELDYNLFAKLQNVRNKFAHRVLDVSFEDPSIRDVCKNINLPKNAYMPRDIETDKRIEKPKLELNPIKKDTPARERFIYAFQFLFVELENRHFVEILEKVEKPSEYMTFPLILERYEKKWKKNKLERMETRQLVNESLKSSNATIKKLKKLLLHEKNEETRKEIEENIEVVKEHTGISTKMIVEMDDEDKESAVLQYQMKTIISWLQNRIEESKE